MEKIRLTTPHETLAVIPHLIGFRPMDSIVIMSLRRGFPHQSGPIVRLELEGQIPPGFIDVVLDFIDTFDVRDLALAWYGSDLETMIGDQESIDILDTAGLAAQRYLDDNVPPDDDGYVTVSLTDYTHWVDCLDIREATWIPFADLVSKKIVRPFDELNESPGVTELVFHGSAPLEDEPEYIDPRAEWSDREAAVLAARKERIRTSQRRKCGNVWREALRLIQEGKPCEQAAPTPEIIGLLNAGLDSILHRDRVILAAVNSNVTDVLKVKKHQISALLGNATADTDHNLTSVTHLVEYVARYSDDCDPAAFAVAAYLRWWANDIEGAGKNAAVASLSDPNYSLAQLVHHALSVRLPSPIDDPVGREGD